jgi:putative membrane protein
MEFFLIVLFILIGILFGIITGITPGIHINLVSAIIIAYSYYLLKIFTPINISITIAAMAITHTVLDILPSTLLGIPDGENLAMLMPAHKLTMKGNAKVAIIYGLIGSYTGIITTLLFVPIMFSLIPAAYEKIKDFVAYILIFISIALILKSKNRIITTLIFITSGIIGIISFNIRTIDQPLLPLLSGLFGLSALVLSIKNNIKLEEQKKDVELKLPRSRIIKHSISATIASLLTNFLPGLTSAHTSIISTKFTEIKDQNEYIIISNATNSSATIISFVALYTLGKARSGAVATIQQLNSDINLNFIFILLAVSLVSLGISIILALKLTNKLIKIVNKINYKKLNYIILILIVIIVLAITRIEGLIILITATSIGILAEKLNIEKIYLTGCLILPVIIYLL